ncbi:hypothetical protein [Falsiroseomonas sp. E2-1-a20]|uniref:hypothetical protein n=1 Tax=Falsiroseomonas sp. E2-1-a20 TaxID=3239300 RepID=UPI003F2F226C
MEPGFNAALAHLTETLRPFREIAERVVREAPDKDAPMAMRARLQLAEMRATIAEATVHALLTDSAISTIRNAAAAGRSAMDLPEGLRVVPFANRNTDTRI